ncbi:hypothetical protein AB1Y20_014790 [Prymnesium parvum]|uniref:Uncharacterized protein n=1 Tax=Prymnesium parvum TaxID=97485 RepID=A0AB34IFG1_PRYPA
MVAEGASAVPTADSAQVFTQRLKEVEREHAALQAVQAELRQDEQRFQALIQAERDKLESCSKQLSTAAARRAKLEEELRKWNSRIEELKIQKAAAAAEIAKLQVEADQSRDMKLRSASTKFPSLAPSLAPGGSRAPAASAPPAAATCAPPAAAPPSFDLLGDLMGEQVATDERHHLAPSAQPSADLFSDEPSSHPQATASGSNPFDRPLAAAPPAAHAAAPPFSMTAQTHRPAMGDESFFDAPPMGMGGYGAAEAAHCYTSSGAMCMMGGAMGTMGGGAAAGFTWGGGGCASSAAGHGRLPIQLPQDLQRSSSGSTGSQQPAKPTKSSGLGVDPFASLVSL